ncbi:MAG TPA: hypothetical protein VFZ85_07825 [Jiangellaceae bacterium]
MELEVRGTAAMTGRMDGQGRSPCPGAGSMAPQPFIKIPGATVAWVIDLLVGRLGAELSVLVLGPKEALA